MDPSCAAPFTVATALSQGITRSQLRSPRLQPVLRGVHISADAHLDLATRADAALLAYPAAVLSHDTAAALYELPEPLLLREAPRPTRGDRSLLQLTVAPKGARPKRAGVRGHVRELDERDIQVVQGLVVTSPARTFLDLAEVWAFPDLLALGDALLRKRLTSKEELQRVIAAAGGQRGVVQARLAAEFASPRSKSAMESIMRARVIAAQLPVPQINVPLCDEFGIRVAEPDLWYREAALALEYEGAHHREGNQYDHDVGRDRGYSRLGIRVVRVIAHDILVAHKEFTDHVALLLGR